jgi:hypothetical protein
MKKQKGGVSKVVEDHRDLEIKTSAKRILKVGGIAKAVDDIERAIRDLRKSTVKAALRSL